MNAIDAIIQLDILLYQTLAIPVNLGFSEMILTIFAILVLIIVNIVQEVKLVNVFNATL